MVSHPKQSSPEHQTGKDFTKHSPARSEYSEPPGKQGKPKTGNSSQKRK